MECQAAKQSHSAGPSRDLSYDERDVLGTHGPVNSRQEAQADIHVLYQGLGPQERVGTATCAAEDSSGPWQVVQPRAFRRRRDGHAGSDIGGACSAQDFAAQHSHLGVLNDESSMSTFREPTRSGAAGNCHDDDQMPALVAVDGLTDDAVVTGKHAGHARTAAGAGSWYERALGVASLDDTSSCTFARADSPRSAVAARPGQLLSTARRIEQAFSCLSMEPSSLSGSELRSPASPMCAAKASCVQSQPWWAAQAPMACSADACVGPERAHAQDAASQTELQVLPEDQLQERVQRLQQQLGRSDSAHRQAMQDAVHEAVQHCEARLPSACVQLSAQLMWAELERTGLSALYAAHPLLCTMSARGPCA
jgi:hypothetical protein